VIDIHCPDPSCDQSVQYSDLRRILDANNLEKFERFAVLSCLKSDETTRWCPNPQCENVYIGEPPDPNDPKIICGECQNAFCYNCKDMWHEGKTCGEYQAVKKPLDKKTSRWMRRQGVQNCPHCGLATIRTTGCRDMTCANCHRHWDWKGDEDETTFEKVAYFYPRSVKYVATSREAHSDDENLFDEIKTNISMGALAALILSPALLITIPTIIPALVITAGRKTKHGVEELIERLNENDEDEKL